jgi:SAM-dependent methyltransferase
MKWIIYIVFKGEKFSMLKENVNVIEKKGINYIKIDTRVRKYQPWIGDLVNYFYDRIMEKSVFPKKFSGNIQLHYDILKKELEEVRGKKVLELATGSGNAVNFLNNNNEYSGIDISPGLLRKACQRFRDNGFQNAEFFLTGAEDLPFQDGMFDIVLCHLSLNFFGNAEKAIQESTRVSKDRAIFFSSVPISERKSNNATIRGKLFSREELKELFETFGWEFVSLPERNGALLYFKAEKRKPQSN